MTGSLSDPGVFYGTYIASFLWPVAAAMVGIALASRPVAADLDRGYLELTLATPVSRTRLLAVAIAGQAAAIAVLAVVMIGAVLVGGAVVNAGFDAGRFLLRSRSTIAFGAAIAGPTTLLSVDHPVARPERRDRGRGAHRHVPDPHPRRDPARPGLARRAELVPVRRSRRGRHRACCRWGTRRNGRRRDRRVGRGARALPAAGPGGLTPPAVRPGRRAPERGRSARSRCPGASARHVGDAAEDDDREDADRAVDER